MKSVKFNKYTHGKLKLITERILKTIKYKENLYKNENHLSTQSRLSGY